MTDRLRAEVKSRLTIPQVAAGFFPGWTAGKSCKSPFRQDKTPSFSVFDSGRAWKDHATNERGDVISFFQKSTGTDFPKAVEALARMAGIFEEKERPQKKASLCFPADLHIGSDAELSGVAKLRNVNLEAVRIASDRGLLRFGTVGGFGCWILTDQSGKAAQARRCDGLPFEAAGGLSARKAHTLKGSCQSWPLGLLEAAEAAFLAVVEGGPDLLAGLMFAHAEGAADRVGVVAMLGAGNRLTDDALPHFRKKRIRIFRHADQAGEKAANGWARQLEAVGCAVDIFDCGGAPLTGGGTSNDLNDLTGMDADFWEENRPLMDHLFDFAEVK